MSDFRLPKRFLLRGSILIIAALTLWKFVLVSPLLGLLRYTTDAIFRILPGQSTPSYSVNASGDWDFQIPVILSGGSRTIRFTAPKDTLINFTFSLPIYWALILAIPAAKSEISTRIRALVSGTVLMILVEAILLVTLIEITSLNIQAQVQPDANAFAAWVRELIDYLALYVMPFLMPFIAAALFDRKFRSVFSGR